MPFLPRSRRAGPDPALPWKIGAFFAGAALFIAGAAIGSDMLILLAIVVVGLGIVMGFFGRRPTGGDREAEIEDATRRRPVEDELEEAEAPTRLEDEDD